MTEIRYQRPSTWRHTLPEKSRLFDQSTQSNCPLTSHQVPCFAPYNHQISIYS